MSEPRHFTSEEALRVGEEIGIDWSSVPFDVEQFRRGMDVELEHGLHDVLTNVTNDDPVITGKIALAHLNEFSDYYTRLEANGRRGEARAGSPVTPRLQTQLAYVRRGEFSVVALLSFAAAVRVVDRLCRGWRTWLGDGRSGSQFSDGVVVRVCVAE